MRTCKICKEVKFEISFFVAKEAFSTSGLYNWRTEICKKCAEQRALNLLEKYIDNNNLYFTR